MRLWHYELIPYLPKGQLLSQWRELNSIFVKQDRHILINYIYNYDKEYLRTYTWLVLDEMNTRGYKVNSMSNLCSYFGDMAFQETNNDLHFNEHNDRYLLQCFYNLQEKFDRGQHDFSGSWYELLNNFMKSKPFLMR